MSKSYFTNLETIKYMKDEQGELRKVTCISTLRDPEITNRLLVTLADEFVAHQEKINIQENIKPLNVLYMTTENPRHISTVFIDIMKVCHPEYNPHEVLSLITFLNISGEPEDIYKGVKEQQAKLANSEAPLTLIVYDDLTPYKKGDPLFDYVHKLQEETGVPAFYVFSGELMVAPPSNPNIAVK